MAGSIVKPASSSSRLITIAADVDTLEDQLSGTTGIATWLAAAKPASGVSMSEGLRYMVERQLPLIVNKATAALPQSADGTLFTIASGNILLESIVGEVTTVIETKANASRLKFNPTGTGADVNLCATNDITADAVGTFYSITGVLADPMQDGLWYVHKMASPIVLGPGVIELECADSNTGSVEWHLMYRIIDTGATVT